MKGIFKINFKSLVVLTAGLFLFCSTAKAQLRNFLTSSDSLNRKRVNISKVVSIGGGAGTLAGLGTLWYSNHDFGRFRFYDDSEEWLGMDKIGHALTAYQGGFYGYNTLRWAGVSERKSIIYGGLYGWYFLLGTELLDGLSDGWGFSGTDMLANSIGAGLYVGQLVLGKQYIQLKYSYWPSTYAQYRPELLGNSLTSSWLKDYNGQIYWASVNLNNLGLKHKYIPDWLSVSFGYSGDGMLGGSSNPIENEAGDILPNFVRQREVYFSFDIDWTKIPTKNPVLKTLFKTLSFVKVPFPGARFAGGKINFQYLSY